MVWKPAPIDPAKPIIHPHPPPVSHENNAKPLEYNQDVDFAIFSIEEIPSPLRLFAESHNNILSLSPLNSGLIENVGWASESCILESTQSMRTVNVNGFLLENLILSPLDEASECLDLEDLTTVKVLLLAFQSQPITWSGELTNVVQGEKIRVFNHKIRFHWVAFLRKLSGERGWLPNKLERYLLQQTSVRVGGNKPTESSSELNANRKAVIFSRSASSASPQKRAATKPGGRSPPLSTPIECEVTQLQAADLGKLRISLCTKPPKWSRGLFGFCSYNALLKRPKELLKSEEEQYIVQVLHKFLRCLSPPLLTEALALRLPDLFIQLMWLRYLEKPGDLTTRQMVLEIIQGCFELDKYLGTRPIDGSYEST
ncbi:hypothetical protein PtA15_8A579 [Puccinia triticina]|uniref:Rho-GAP domain-containing protein n=1 Tax=Puccinia triticina TaxID=208348 RepID=A0ABY7CTJ4_9BASI|nr:uncharacterized protein PtA15_8A579 [Puccinia triticina]WAQ87673.1 hypothetical protein PtA15_8A579 [Puccinia triticina]WAR57531.1 hypothetical protein PtB15_8B582 [Puccinia triticina]